MNTLKLDPPRSRAEKRTDREHPAGGRFGLQPDDQARAQLIAHLVSLATDLSAGEILHGSGGDPRILRARQVAIYLAAVGLGWTLTRAGAAFGRDRTTAGIACRRVEDLRDDPRLDRALDAIERFLTSEAFNDGALA